MLLPSYSPDLNPIEFTFSWLKTFLRGVQARSRRALVNAIVRAEGLSGEVLACSWFAGCGYIVWFSTNTKITVEISERLPWFVSKLDEIYAVEPKPSEILFGGRFRSSS
jgi:hypothetical protein